VAYAMAPGWNWNAEQFLGRDLQGPWMRTVLKPLSSGPPVVLIQGAQDDITPTSLASAWLRRAAVAEKLVCIVSGAGHNAILSAPADIDAVMTHVVSPLAQGIRPHPEALSTCVPP
jgi:pimeloyl-ACP methyl ester carboxylesterase